MLCGSCAESNAAAPIKERHTQSDLAVTACSFIIVILLYINMAIGIERRKGTGGLKAQRGMGLYKVRSERRGVVPFTGYAGTHKTQLQRLMQWQCIISHVELVMGLMDFISIF